MKKIYITKTDSPTVVVHKILSCPEDDIVLYVPKGSEVSSDPKNFKLIKREVSAVGKNVIVESVDGDALELASACGFEVADGLFRRSKVPLMDIMPGNRPKTDHPTAVRHGDECECEHHKTEDIDEFSSDDNSSFSDSDDGEYGQRHPIRRFFIVLSAVIVLGGIFYICAFKLPRADIRMTMKKTEWSFKENITASPGVAAVTVENSAIPAELFKISKNGVYPFPASGSKMVENKATGKITIYNAYSSDAQPLVKNTRFVTPDGKIFRVTASLTVPGAKIVDGKIIPSSVESAVVADAAGDTYNTKTVSKLTIPGFQGTPKYDGFYGELKEGASGGKVGEIKVPTEADLKNAAEVSRRSVEDALKAEIMASVPTGFKVLDQGADIRVVKEGVVGDANEKGEFTYGIMLEAKVVAFRENDALSLMQAKFASEHTDGFDLKEYVFSYGSPTIDFTSGKMTVPVEFNSLWSRSFNASEFKDKVISKNSSELKALIFSVSGIESGKADLWPIWVFSVPKDGLRVNVTVE
ncbi:MAG: hypothetical protein PHG66_03750 [Candidatus Colwellbacteria bacterium]|nr:hypothetical protein [Candidatus Colwellbacteria bacterium]